ncbi:hypothetical protein GJS40_13165 [Aliibacillus thermotolerans]|nr:hypothetical protein [Aliibacillus thermotolerans]
MVIFSYVIIIIFILISRRYNALRKKVVGNYVVNSRTMALVPVLQGDMKTKIYEKGNEVKFSEYSPIQIMRLSCLERGASLEGRFESIRYRLGVKQKVPVPIDLFADIYGIPLLSPRNVENVWLFLNHVEKAEIVVAGRQASILFPDGQLLVVNTTKYIIDQQIAKASKCKLLFKEHELELMRYGLM